MKKNTLFAAALSIVALSAVPAFAQDGAFKDVPGDHWAYSAIENLAAKKIFIGDPDGQFRGKRNMTRYEMAVVLDRMLKAVQEMMPASSGAAIDTSKFATKDDLMKYLLKSDYRPSTGGGTTVDTSRFATKEDFNTLNRLVKEFQTELTTLNVDVEATKKRLDNLEKRVAKLEEMMAGGNKSGVQISGEVMMGARGNARDKKAGAGSFVDYNGQGGVGASKYLLADTGTTHSANLNLAGKVGENADAMVTFTVGNYLPLINNTLQARLGGSRDIRMANVDRFDITQAYVNTGAKLPVLGETKMTVGRQPVQFTKYTLKGVDPDTYFSNSLTDNGNVYVDGLKGNFNIGPFGVMGIAGRVSQNMNANAFTTGAGTLTPDQLGGLHATVKAGPVNLAGTYVAHGVSNIAGIDRVNTSSISANFNVAGRTIYAEQAKTETVNGSTRVLTSNNTATDISTQLFGNAERGLGVGYREIKNNFMAPGNWGTGFNVNPVNVKGPYFHGTLPLSGFQLDGQLFSNKGTTTATKNDKSTFFIGNIVKGNWNLMLDSTNLKPNGGLETTRTFYGVGYKPHGNLSLMYQVTDFKPKGGASTKGNIVTAQYNVKF